MAVHMAKQLDAITARAFQLKVCVCFRDPKIEDFGLRHPSLLVEEIRNWPPAATRIFYSQIQALLSRHTKQMKGNF